MNKNGNRLCMCIAYALLILILTGCRENRLELLEDTATNTTTGQNGTAHSDAAQSNVAGSSNAQATTASEQTGNGTTDLAEQNLIYVFLYGEVIAPGVYEVPENSRLYEVIALAGGYTEIADATYLNIARIVTDGEQIYVPSTEETAELDSSWTTEAGVSRTNESTSAGITADGRVNLNTASVEELCTLTGIGESRANDIIQYRTEHGNFQTIEEIQNVTGIKSAVFEKIKDSIVV